MISPISFSKNLIQFSSIEPISFQDGFSNFLKSNFLDSNTLTVSNSNSGIQMNINNSQPVGIPNYNENLNNDVLSGISGIENLKQTNAFDYNEIIKQASQTYNVPEKLINSVIRAESSFNPNALSKSGAQGLMQLMPGTAKEMGVSDPFNPEQNIFGGVKYLSNLINRYDGNLRYALAAYNAGPTNVDNYNGVPPFKETQDYVKKILG